MRFDLLPPSLEFDAAYPLGRPDVSELVTIATAGTAYTDVPNPDGKVFMVDRIHATVSNVVLQHLNPNVTLWAGFTGSYNSSDTTVYPGLYLPAYLPGGVRYSYGQSLTIRGFYLNADPSITFINRAIYAYNTTVSGGTVYQVPEGKRFVLLNYYQASNNVTLRVHYGNILGQSGHYGVDSVWYGYSGHYGGSDTLRRPIILNPGDALDVGTTNVTGTIHGYELTA